jgi:6-phosphogluconolactonase
VAHVAGIDARDAEVRVLPDPAALTRAAADLFVAEARAAIDARRHFSVALSGGSTPRSLYSLLVTDSSLRDAVAWDRVHLFWGDERHVPPGHAQSNYRMVREALIDHVDMPRENVHRIVGELTDAAEAARAYQIELQRFFDLQYNEWPVFDLVLLGLGTDAHTASLFPGSVALGEREALCIANWVEAAAAFRITLTAPVLNAARAVVFLVSGTDKAQAVASVLQGERDPLRFPAQLIQPQAGRLVWLLDRTAAGALRRAES